MFLINKEIAKCKGFVLLVISVLLLLTTSSCHHYASNIFTYNYVTMSTVLEMRFEADSVGMANKLKDQVITEVERLESIFDRNIEVSEVSVVNNNAGIRPVKVSKELFYLVEEAIEYATLTEGAFDPTIAPLVDLWGFIDFDQERDDYRVPQDYEIASKLELVDYKLIELNKDNSTIYLPVEGMALELGGIAKGYIVDRALDILKREGIENAYINAGGDIALLGKRPDGNLWRIAIEHPRKESADHYLAILDISDSAVLTSGDYIKYFEKGGKRYHHLLDPQTGMPANLLISVTIIAETATDADALSTAVFVMGPLEGFALIEGIKGVEAVMVKPDFEILISSGLVELLEIQ